MHKQVITRRATISGRQKAPAIRPARLPVVDQRASVGARQARLAARKWRSRRNRPTRPPIQPRGRIGLEGDRPSHTTILRRRRAARHIDLVARSDRQYAGPGRDQQPVRHRGAKTANANSGCRFSQPASKRGVRRSTKQGELARSARQPRDIYGKLLLTGRARLAPACRTGYPMAESRQPSWAARHRILLARRVPCSHVRSSRAA